MYFCVNVHAENMWIVALCVYVCVIYMYRLLEAKSLLGLREDNHNQHALTILMEVNYDVFLSDGWTYVCMYTSSAAV